MTPPPDFSFQDIRDLVKDITEAVATQVKSIQDELSEFKRDIKEDTKYIYIELDKIKLAVNPKIEKILTKTGALEKCIEGHLLDHKDEQKFGVSKAKLGLTEKSFRWQKGFTIFLIFANIITVAISGALAYNVLKDNKNGKAETPNTITTEKTQK